MIQGLGTLTVAGIVAYIAWQQHQTAQSKLRLDLFDRRYRIYRGLMNLFTAVEAEKLDNSEPGKERPLGKFDRVTDAKRFLLGDEVVQFLTEVRSKVVSHRSISRRVDSWQGEREGPRFDAVVKEESDLYQWIQEAQEKAAPLFAKYLGFKKL